MSDREKARERQREADGVERRMDAIAAAVAAIMAFGSLATGLLFGYSVANGIQQDLATGELYAVDVDGGVDLVSEQHATGHRVATHIEVPEGHGVTVSAEGLSEGEVAVMLIATEGGPAVFDHSFIAGDGDDVVTEDEIEPRRYLLNARAMGSTGTITVRTHPIDGGEEEEEGEEAAAPESAEGSEAEEPASETPETPEATEDSEDSEGDSDE